MQRCTECGGKGYLQNGESIEVGLGSSTFTPKATASVAVCPTCLGNGYNAGAGT